MQFKQSHVFCIQGAKQMNIDVPFETIFHTTVASRSRFLFGSNSNFYCLHVLPPLHPYYTICS
jgi:hypothetical protein